MILVLLSLPSTQRVFLYPSPLTIQAVGVSRQRVSLPLSQPTPISWGPLHSQHAFLVSGGSPANLGRELPCKLNATISCNEKVVFISLPSDQAPNFLFPLLEIHCQLNSSEEDEIYSKVVPNRLWATHVNKVGVPECRVPLHY